MDVDVDLDGLWMDMDAKTSELQEALTARKPHSIRNPTMSLQTHKTKVCAYVHKGVMHTQKL
jgi:hypothetical protein